LAQRQRWRPTSVKRGFNVSHFRDIGLRLGECQSTRREMPIRMQQTNQGANKLAQVASGPATKIYLKQRFINLYTSPISDNSHRSRDFYCKKFM